MKKVGIILLLIIILINLKPEVSNSKEEQKGVFISYIELKKYIVKDNIEESKKNINKMIQNVKNFNLNEIVLQVRASCDAIYLSSMFPNEYIEKDWDILEYFLQETHKNNIKLIAWINPYRVSTNSDIDQIPKNSPAYPYIGTNVIYINNGIYLNPSKEETEKIIIEGVKEVLEYKVDGILFDDYFYPADDIDNKEYEKYIKENKYISKKDYHLQTVNKLIKKVYNECHKKNVKFGVSPDGNIDNNYNKNYADVFKWMREDGYIDFIMPQIYYGFYNSTKAYKKVLEEWEEHLENDKIELYIALAFYKVGKVDKYAKDGRDEWLQHDDIIMREIILSRNTKNYEGFCLFRYDNIFDTENYTPTSIKEIENLKKIIK